MAAPPRSIHPGWNHVLTFLAATLLCAALVFGMAFVWHVSQAGTYAGTYVVISGWVASAFVLASLLVVTTALVRRRRDSSTLGAVARWPIAVWLVSAAWLIIAIVWVAAGA